MTESGKTKAPGSFTSIAVVCLAALVLGMPMLLYGPLADGHDTYEHLTFTKYFSEQFWNGDHYPRWLMDMNHGLGSPTYFVFPPLPAYVCALLSPVARLFHFSAFNFAAFLPLLISGISAWLLLATMVAPYEAVIGACLYMAMPYHLLIDFYLRCAIPESWALAWMPLALYFLPAALKGRSRGVVGLAASLALMIFSHLISVAMFLPVLLTAAIYFAPPGRRTRGFVLVAVAMVLGAGVASIYLLPSLVNARYISAARLVALTNFNWTTHLLSFGKGLFAHDVGKVAGFQREVSWSDLSIFAFAVLGSLISAGSAIRALRRGTFFWFVVCFGSLFMTSRASSRIWAHIAGLQQAVQFPWRFSAILCIGALSILGILLTQCPWGSEKGIGRVRLLLLAAAAAWLSSYGYACWRYHVAVEPGPSEKLLVNDHDGWFFAWSPPDMDQRAALLASFGPRVRFREDGGSANLTMWSPRRIEFKTNSHDGGWVMVNQFYYPTWIARNDNASLEVRPALPEGLLQVRVPFGTQNVRLEIPVSKAESLGRWLSIACIAACLFIAKLSEGKQR